MLWERAMLISDGDDDPHRHQAPQAQDSLHA
jgi:hypothetical protein